MYSVSIWLSEPAKFCMHYIWLGLNWQTLHNQPIHNLVKVAHLKSPVLATFHDKKRDCLLLH
jgi:hypothetical protein